MSMCSTRSFRTDLRLDPGARDNERNVQAFVVQELLTASVTDPMIGHEQNERVVTNPFLVESVENLSDHGVGHADGIQISSPVTQNVGMIGVIGWQRDRVDGGPAAELSLRRGGNLLPSVGILAAKLPSGCLDLSKEGLALLSLRPVASIVDRRVPLEVVIGLSQFSFPHRPSGDGGVIPGLLKELGHELDALGQMDLFARRVRCGDGELRCSSGTSR